MFRPDSRWGLLTVLVNYDEVTNGQDAYLATLRNMVGAWRAVVLTSALQRSYV